MSNKKYLIAFFLLTILSILNFYDSGPHELNEIISMLSIFLAGICLGLLSKGRKDNE